MLFIHKILLKFTFLIKIPGCHFGRILKHNIFLVPMGGDLFWAGSTSRLEFDDPNPSEYGRQWLISELQKTLAVPFEIVEHLAGIRPTVADVRPFLGFHKEHAALAIFNGLGTKGALLGPYFAKQMADFLLVNTRLDAAVDINRIEQTGRKGHFFSKQT